jgi:RES domain-containing protein
LAGTLDSIEGAQRPDGFIPHFSGGVGDPWDHVEAAMGLDVGLRNNAAERAYRWLANNQNHDGSWFTTYGDSGPTDRTRDANFTCYVAAGCWHHYLATADVSFLRTMWRTIERAVEFTLGLQAMDGSVMWARDPVGNTWPAPLVTSCSCIYLSLRCAVAIAETIGHERPDWELSAAQLQAAIVGRPEVFESKDRYSMDWYYPVLGTALGGVAATERLKSRWDEFVVPGLGALCVGDRPWVTSGESAELVLALDVAGLHEHALEVFTWLQHLRAPTGGYWTGATFPDATVWPREQPTWAAGAVLLAADALWGEGLTSGFFRAESLPEPFELTESIPDAP